MTVRENRGYFLHVPLTKEEQDRVFRCAEKDNRSMAQWAKLKLLKNLPK